MVIDGGIVVLGQMVDVVVLVTLTVPRLYGPCLELSLLTIIYINLNILVVVGVVVAPCVVVVVD